MNQSEPVFPDFTHIYFLDLSEGALCGVDIVLREVKERWVVCFCDTSKTIFVRWTQNHSVAETY